MTISQNTDVAASTHVALLPNSCCDFNRSSDQQEMELFRITSDLDHPLIAFDQVFKKIIPVY